mgnify:CR=1 FL=1
MSNFLKAFNNHLVDFMNDILVLLNKKEKNEMETYKIFVEKLIKSNASMIIKIWKKYIMDKYIDNISNNDFDFFLNKDYNYISKNNKNVEGLIEKIKNIVSKMNDENREKALKYIGYNTTNLPAAIEAFKIHFIQSDITKTLTPVDILVLYNVYLKY